MFGKVFKYEMKAVARVLVPLYGAVLLVALLFSLSTLLNISLAEIRDNGPLFTEIVQFLLSLLFFAGLIACSVVTLVVLARRFFSNFLGNEGYLQLSLPVGMRTHLAARSLSAFVWSLAGSLTACLAISAVAFVLSFRFHELSGLWKEILEFIRDLDLDPPIFLLLILTLLAESLSSIERLYAAIAIGHLWDGHRLIGAVLAYIGIGFAWSSFSGTLTGIVFQGAYGPLTGLLGVFEEEAVPVLLFTLVMALVQTGVYYLLTWFILDRNLNLD